MQELAKDIPFAHKNEVGVHIFSCKISGPFQKIEKVELEEATPPTVIPYEWVWRIFASCSVSYSCVPLSQSNDINLFRAMSGFSPDQVNAQL